MRACALWLNKESYLYIQWRHRSGRNGSDSAVGAPTGEPRKKKKSSLPRLLLHSRVPNNVRSLRKLVFWVFRRKQRASVFLYIVCLCIWPAGWKFKGCHWNLNWHPPAWNWIRQVNVCLLSSPLPPPVNHSMRIHKTGIIIYLKINLIII